MHSRGIEAALLALALGCGRTSVSSLKDDPAQRVQATEALAILGVSDMPGATDTCSRCHSLTVNTLQTWGDNATSVKQSCLSNLDAETWQTPNAAAATSVLNCLQDSNRHFSASKLGFYAAAAHLDRAKNLFRKAYSSFSFPRKYDNFLQTAGMPKDGRDQLSDEDFTKVMAWVDAGMPYLRELVHESTGSTDCTPSYTTALSDHLADMQLRGWQAKHRENGLLMFGCSSEDALECFSQTDSHGSAKFVDATSVAQGQGWNRDFPEAKFRLLERINVDTSFWMRTSPDGRFVANGGASSIIDLQNLLSEGGQARYIEVDASYDPSFFPDNSGFMFQGSGTGLCPISVLRDTSINSIDWTQRGCTRSSASSNSIPLYQGVGASLDGSDFLAVTGSFESDSGNGGTGTDQAFSASSRARFQTFVNDGQRYRFLGDTSIDTPHQGDFNVSPSNSLMITRRTRDEDSSRPFPETYTLGYKIYKLTRTTSGSSFSMRADEIANICMDGKKGMLSFNERFWVTYAKVNESQYAEYGYASANEPEFRAMIEHETVNVLVHDLLTHQTRRITRLRPGQMALFPHFRADGWIIFMLNDTNTQQRTIVATDAAIRMER